MPICDSPIGSGISLSKLRGGMVIADWRRRNDSARMKLNERAGNERVLLGRADQSSMAQILAQAGRNTQHTWPT